MHVQARCFSASFSVLLYFLDSFQRRLPKQLASGKEAGPAGAAPDIAAGILSDQCANPKCQHGGEVREQLSP